MIRTIDGFHRDDAGDWVAELSCLHNQHIRHRPPFQNFEWIDSTADRQARIGTAIECPLCDRAELPGDLELVRTAGPFDETTLPAALQRAHRVAERTWGQVRVTRGTITFAMDVTPALVVELHEGDRQSIPPGVPHELRLQGPVEVVVDFLVSVTRAKRTP